MINPALRLPEPSIRYLHACVLEVPSSISPDDVRAEIAFCKHAHAIASDSALATAITRAWTRERSSY